MTFEKKFLSLKTKFNKADVKKLPDNFAIQLTMTDDDCGGTFYIADFDGTFSVEPFDYVDNNAAVTGTSAAIAEIAEGKVNSSLDIFGSTEIVSALAAAFSPAKKPVLKKPAAKKACGSKCAKPAAKAVAKTTAKVASKVAEKSAEKAGKAAKPAADKAAK